MGLALVLLVGAALFIRTFLALRAVDPGFDAHLLLTGVALLGVWLPAGRAARVDPVIALRME